MCGHTKIIFYSILIIITISSCATAPVCITSSNTPLNDKKISENLGKVEGESDSWTISLFCLWTLGKPDIQSAIDNALSKKKGDALINIKCYEDGYNFILFGLTKVKIEGEAVIFQKQSEEPDVE
ncbi:MAG: hypothetical protein V1874_17435 [Spirochaetota bacterium]